MQLRIQLGRGAVDDLVQSLTRTANDLQAGARPFFFDITACTRLHGHQDHLVPVALRLLALGGSCVAQAPLAATIPALGVCEQAVGVGMSGT